MSQGSLTGSRIICLGEAMVELSPRQGGWHVHYGGDTLNLALHLTRLGHRTAYLTALGTDPFAGSMKSDWGREGMDTSLVLTHPTRTTGLYAIETDQRGERHFSYWRGESAAREMFDCEGIDYAQDQVRAADLFAFSLISLAILPERRRKRVIGLAQEVREHGGKVAFDSNYRARLWEDREAARYWRDAAIEVANFGLPTLEDEVALQPEEDEDQVALRWEARGCGEVVVKLGAHGCRLPDGTLQQPEQLYDALDSSGAGDAFDAGYLAARMRGAELALAARHGERLAAWVLMRSGAIPPRDHAAPYGSMLVGGPE
jgi:2-dehydro-3-deoxygluconokinase